MATLVAKTKDGPASEYLCNSFILETGFELHKRRTGKLKRPFWFFFAAFGALSSLILIAVGVQFRAWTLVAFFVFLFVVQCYAAMKLRG